MDRPPRFSTVALVASQKFRGDVEGIRQHVEATNAVV
jgi:hypothetical protein